MEQKRTNLLKKIWQLQSNCLSLTSSLNINHMHTRNFNRHANMKQGTLSVIMNLIKNTDDHKLTNMLYGLFDGYDYTDSIMNIADNMDKTSDYYCLLTLVCTEIKTYPDGVTEI